MDAKESAALRELAERPEWPVHELPASLGANMLRCLDQAGLVEVAAVDLADEEDRLRSPGRGGPDSRAWFSPVADPEAAVDWQVIRHAAPLRGPRRMVETREVVRKDFGGITPKQVRQFQRTDPAVPGYYVRITERGTARLPWIRLSTPPPAATDRPTSDRPASPEDLSRALRHGDDLVRRFNDIAARWPTLGSELVVFSMNLGPDELQCRPCGSRGGTIQKPPRCFSGLSLGMQLPSWTLHDRMNAGLREGRSEPEDPGADPRAEPQLEIENIGPGYARLLPVGPDGSSPAAADAKQQFDELSLAAWRVVEELGESPWPLLARPSTPIDPEAGVFNEAWLANYRMDRDAAERTRWESGTAPSAQRRTRDLMTGPSVQDRWIFAVHNLAWNRAAGSLLRADLRTWDIPGSTFSLDLLFGSREAAWLAPLIPAHASLVPLRWFESVLEGNVFRASAVALGLLIDAARTDAFGPSTSPDATARGESSESPISIQRDDAEEQPPALTKNERLVLQTLAKLDSRVLATIEQVRKAMDVRARLAPRTIGPILTRLIELDLVERPEGETRGARLTSRGRRLVPKIAD